MVTVMYTKSLVFEDLSSLFCKHAPNARKHGAQCCALIVQKYTLHIGKVIILYNIHWAEIKFILLIF
jgi:hypothetical protein